MKKQAGWKNPDNAVEPPDNRKDWPKEPFTFAKWGLAIGTAAAIAYVNAHKIVLMDTPMYPGDAGIPIMLGFIGGAVAGFAAGWVWVFIRGREED